MPSIAAERALAGLDVLPLKGSVAAPLPEHVREAAAAALGEHAVTPPSRGHLALRDRVVPVEEAVARLTSRAAERLGLGDRGRIAPGKRADLVLLDPAAYLDAATYEEPLLLAEGVVGTWVAGERVWGSA